MRKQNERRCIARGTLNSEGVYVQGSDNKKKKKEPRRENRARINHKLAATRLWKRMFHGRWKRHRLPQLTSFISPSRWRPIMIDSLVRCFSCFFFVWYSVGVEIDFVRVRYRRLGLVFASGHCHFIRSRKSDWKQLFTFLQQSLIDGETDNLQPCLFFWSK